MLCAICVLSLFWAAETESSGRGVTCRLESSRIMLKYVEDVEVSFSLAMYVRRIPLMGFVGVKLRP